MSIDKNNAADLVRDGHQFDILDHKAIEWLHAQGNTDATAIWVYLATRPENWKVIPQQLQQSHRLSRDRYRAAMRLLIEGGLLKREALRKGGHGGAFCGSRYRVSNTLGWYKTPETGTDEKPSCRANTRTDEKPNVPDTGQPAASADEKINNTDLKTNNTDNNTQRVREDAETKQKPATPKPPPDPGILSGETKTQRDDRSQFEAKWLEPFILFARENRWKVCGDKKIADLLRDVQDAGFTLNQLQSEILIERNPGNIAQGIPNALRALNAKRKASQQTTPAAGDSPPQCFRCGAEPDGFSVGGKPACMQCYEEIRADWHAGGGSNAS